VQAAVGEYIRYELDKSTNPSEMAAAVLAATTAASSPPAASCSKDPTGGTMEDVSMKTEADVLAGTGAGRKRRRAEAGPTVSTNLLPDREALEGIELLLDLFGEAIQPHITAALRSLEARAAANQQEQPAAAAAAMSRSGKIVISRNNLNAATAFI
jgi:hypothetical protein